MSYTSTSSSPTQSPTHYSQEPTEKPIEQPELPMKPSFVLKNYRNKLSRHEIGEILDFPQVYYYGERAKKKIDVNPANTNNQGYDDKNGDYYLYSNDHIAYRYEIVSTLGKGSFGQCVKVYDHKSKKYAALKIIRNRKRFHKQGLIEVKILEYIRDHDPEDSFNNVRLYEYLYFRNHLCIIFELLSHNLYEFMKDTNFQSLSLALIRRFTIQLLNSLRYLSLNRIIHCDLKPENILLKNPTKSGIKVIDFGSSCFVGQTLYTYIQSRFYRSPEVILGMPYDTAIDMWSLGCILCELYIGYPIFPGQDETEQLGCIMEVLGLPPPSMMESAQRWSHFFDSHNQPLVTEFRTEESKLPRRRRPGGKTLVGVLHCSDELFLSFVEGCLRWDPLQRFNAQTAIQHPWILGPRVPPPADPSRTYLVRSTHSIQAPPSAKISGSRNNSRVPSASTASRHKPPPPAADTLPSSRPTPRLHHKTIYKDGEGNDAAQHTPRGSKQTQYSWLAEGYTEETPVGGGQTLHTPSSTKHTRTNSASRRKARGTDHTPKAEATPQNPAAAPDASSQFTLPPFSAHGPTTSFTQSQTFNQPSSHRLRMSYDVSMRQKY